MWNCDAGADVCCLSSQSSFGLEMGLTPLRTSSIIRESEKQKMGQPYTWSKDVFFEGKTRQGKKALLEEKTTQELPRFVTLSHVISMNFWLHKGDLAGLDVFIMKEEIGREPLQLGCQGW